MKLEVIRTLPAWLAIREEWNGLLARSAVRVPFLRHEFLTAWWTHLGGCGEWPRGELYVVLARDDVRLVAAAPLFASVDRKDDPVLAFLGSDAMADYLDMLAEPEFLAQFVDALLDHLARDASSLHESLNRGTAADAPVWRSIDLFNLQDDSPLRAELQRAAAARSLKIRQNVLSTCRYVLLEPDWENYLARAVDKKHRHEIRRKLRRADEAPGLRWYFVEDVASIPAATADLLALMSQNQEKRELLTPELLALWNDILLAAGQGGGLRLAFLEIEGAKAAGCVAFDFDGRLWIYNTGIDERFRNYSPGSVLLIYVLQWAIAAGRTEVDFLRGDQEFKTWFGSQERRVYCLRLLRAEADADDGEEPSLHAAIDDELLAAGLGAASIVERGELPALAGGDCEIVTCRMPRRSLEDSPDMKARAADRLKRLFCKFGPPEEEAGPTHRFGIGYEAQVYDQLLCSWPGDVPPLHGFFLDDQSRIVVLALAYVDGTPLSQASQPKAGLAAAADWIARFHAWGETVAVPEFLRRYDTEFYRAWLARATDVTRGLHAQFAWLPELCERCARRLPALLPAATIIHGEYQANNILVHRGKNVATDWESAALAAGEIDLAGLTWGWDEALAAMCEQQYCLARWPNGAPADFLLRLTAARVFLHLRWLGDMDSTDADAIGGALEELAPLAERFKSSDR